MISKENIYSKIKSLSLVPKLEEEELSNLAGITFLGAILLVGGILSHRGTKLATMIQVLFSGLLVLLYFVQSRYMSQQSDIMERQQKLMSIEHKSEVVFEEWGVAEIERDKNFTRPKLYFRLSNIGDGLAKDIRASIHVQIFEGESVLSSNIENLDERAAEETDDEYAQFNIQREKKGPKGNFLHSKEENILFKGEPMVKDLETKGTFLPFNSFVSKYCEPGDKLRVILRIDYSDRTGDSYHIVPYCIEQELEDVENVFIHNMDRNYGKSTFYNVDGMEIPKNKANDN